MLPIVDRIIRVLCYVVLAVLIVMGFVMLGVSWAHIYYRYFQNSSLSWSEELLKILVVWFCLLSASFISVRRDHVRITIFKSKMPAPVEKAMDYLVSFLMFLASVIMCYVGYRLAMWAGMRKTPVLRIPFFYMYISICVSFALMALYELRNFLADIFAPGSPPAMVDNEASEFAAIEEDNESAQPGVTQ